MCVMELLLDIVSYAVTLGCEFTVLCAITKVGRGWLLQFSGLAAIAVFDVAFEWWYRTGHVPLSRWLTVFCPAWMALLAALVFALSRFSCGQRLFLSFIYGAYAAFYASLYHVFVYRGIEATGSNILGLTPVWACVSGTLAVVAANSGFVYWVLPRIPRGGSGFRWTEPCLGAGVMFLLVYGSGIWPIPVVDAPVPYCLLFVLVSAAAWFYFPLICRQMRDRQRNADVEQSLRLMTAEVEMRRAAIDEARRIRHDHRHHRAQIAEYLLFGQTDKALKYLGELDEAAKESSADRLIWCGNETVNAILSVASRKAAAQGVGFVAEADVDRPLGLSEVETVAVIANLIENAIDEVERRGGGGGGRRTVASDSHATGISRPPCDASTKGDAAFLPRENTKDAHHSPPLLSTSTQPHLSTSSSLVTVLIRQRLFGFGVTVANPVPAGFALSAKGLPCEEPGVGMESVRRVVERHRGTWTYELRDGVLKCQVILMPGETT